MRNNIKNVLFVSFLSNLIILNSNLHSKSFLKKLSDFNKKNCENVTQTFDNFHTVEIGKIYRSKQLSAKKFESYIKKYGIKTIINLRGKNPTKKWWQKENRVAQNNGITFYNIPLSAIRLPSKEHIEELLRIYDCALQPILIHCQGGADRTGMASALWKIYKQKTTKATAQKQLSLKFGHRKLKNPAMDFFVDIWQGKSWLLNEYYPKNYPAYN